MALSTISELATAELGEYILYRDNIIKGLELAIKDSSKKEDYIHNIFMQKNTFDLGEPDRYTLSNLWLLDDKFMSYIQAFSDVSIKNITMKEQGFLNGNITGLLHRPDLSLFYSNLSDGTKNVVMLELKGANASKDEKKKAITELPDDISILRKALNEQPNIIWGYIITSIDDEFEMSLKNQDFMPLFTSSGNSQIYYRYYETVNSHIYVMDLNAICDDAFARNKTFLDILKKQ